MYLQKLLNSDWLRAVQFKTSVWSVQCKLHIVILDYDWLKDNGNLYLQKWLDCVISAFWKPHEFVEINSKLNSKTI